eukprot:TRINITY_DN10117_c0_g2_i1.p1 TRINITY_DN10117_c0_g2~~TRINITY_DN10117_c0_g2_i1.p1  ORF type:complete len:783 (+),score=110.23 TRINITY_DN10117_c0_g2_i1:181-2529(+)
MALLPLFVAASVLCACISLAAAQIPCRPCTLNCETQCASNQYLTKTPGISQFNVCLDCPFHMRSAGSCVETCQDVDCDADEYNDDHTCKPCNSLVTKLRLTTGREINRCTSFTTCPPGTSVVFAGNHTHDRECAPCANGTYTDKSNQATCLALIRDCNGQPLAFAGNATSQPRCCPTGQYEVRNTTTDAFIRCANYTICDDRSQSTLTPAYDLTSDQRCINFCRPGFYVERPGSSTSCKLISENCPRAKEYIVKNATMLSDIECAVCPDGSYSDGVSCIFLNCTPGFAQVNDRCQACPANHFTNTSNATSCTRWTDCPNGQGAIVPGSSSSDRVCGECPFGTFASFGSRCQAWKQCPDPHRRGTPTQDAVCCDRDLAGFYEQATFVPGTNNTIASAASCLPRDLTQCLRGQYRPVPPPFDRDNSCVAPPDSMYIADVTSSYNIALKKHIFSYDLRNKTVCARNQYVWHSGSATSDRRCVTCFPGTVVPGNIPVPKQPNCQPQPSVCPPGTGTVRASNPNAFNTTTNLWNCFPCTPGVTYSTGGGTTRCRDVAECSGGEVEVQAPNITHDRDCQRCAFGYKLPVGANSLDACEACPAGSSSNLFRTTCQPCRAGQTAPTAGSMCRTCRSSAREYLINATTPCGRCPDDALYTPSNMTCHFGVKISTPAATTTTSSSSSIATSAPAIATATRGTTITASAATITTRAAEDSAPASTSDTTGSSSSSRSSDTNIGLAVGMSLLVIVTAVGAGLYYRRRVSTKNKTAANSMLENPTYSSDTLASTA